jgi:hypothetical protein
MVSRHRRHLPPRGPSRSSYRPMGRSIHSSFHRHGVRRIGVACPSRLSSSS